MSLYNMIFGVNPLAGVVLKALNLEQDNIPRLRDAYYDCDDDVLVVFTRTGGGNREYYETCIEEDYDGPTNLDLQNHSHYLRDEDDDFDSTYAYFYFSVPDESRELFNEIRKLMLEYRANNPTGEE